MKKRYFALIPIFICFILCSFFWGKKTNELVINSLMSDEAPKKGLEMVVKKFEEKYPDIKVTINTIAMEQFKPMLSSYLTSKNAPDVITWFAAYRMQAHAKRGLLEPIDDIFPGKKFEVEFPKAFKEACSYNGKVYALPHTWYWWAVYYNKEVFQKAGITKIPQTWDDFLTVCETLKSKGFDPIAIGARDTWTAGGWFDYINSAVNGGAFHKKLMDGKAAYTDPKVKKSMQYLIELQKKGYIMDNATSYSWQEAATRMFNGEAGMYLMGQFIYDVAPENVKSRLDFFTFPKVNRQEYYVDTPLDCYLLPKKARNKKNAKLFLQFVATKEIQDLYATPMGRFAANKNVQAPNPQAEKGLKMVLGAAGAMQFYDRDAPEEMAAKGMEAIIEIWENPDKIDQILTRLDSERKRIYE